MGKKQKKVVKAQEFRKREEEVISSPFSSIILKEKKEEEKTSRPKAAFGGKKPSEIVGGYDPKASFADILASYERTGNPYSMPQKGGVDKKGPSMDFAAILEKWENRGKIKPDNPSRKKSTYTATKSFGDILSEFETGKPAEKGICQKKQQKDGEGEQTTLPEPLKDQDALFKKPEEDEKRSPVASWSIFGDNKSFVRKQVEKKGFDTDPIAPSSKQYNPTKPFSEILSSYYSGERKSEKAIGDAGNKTFEQILKEKGDDEKRTRSYTVSELRAMLPQSTLDLHGMNQEECIKAVEDFLSDAKKNGLRKISIITGKGLHSDNGIPVLKETAERVLENSGLVSEQSRAPSSHGGGGAIWIILKKE